MSVCSMCKCECVSAVPLERRQPPFRIDDDADADDDAKTGSGAANGCQQRGRHSSQTGFAVCLL